MGCLLNFYKARLVNPVEVLTVTTRVIPFTVFFWYNFVSASFPDLKGSVFFNQNNEITNVESRNDTSQFLLTLSVVILDEKKGME